MLKVLVVDDSALMRKYLRDIFLSEGGFEVALARNGQEALDQVRQFRPDVVTLDIHMPQMDGLTCLSHIMVEDPRPVVMVSSLTTEDALPTLEALAMGAVDCVAKPGGTVSLQLKQVAPELVRKVRAAAGARVSRARNLKARLARQQAPKPVRTSVTAHADPYVRGRASPVSSLGATPKCLLIGASTGGPRAFEELLPKLPAGFPIPVVVAIHMPGTFTGYFAHRMGELCALPVEEVERQAVLAPGHVYVAKGDADLVLARRAGQLVALCVPMDTSYLWHPSIERMVLSALEHVPAAELIAVELTGMGHDGAPAMAKLRQRGGHTIAESEETAVVFGMPKELIERNGAEVVLPLDRIAEQIVRWV